MTDDLDRRCLMSVLRKYITPHVLSEDYKFVPNSGVYYSPPPGGLEQYRQGILLQPDLQLVRLRLACTGRASRYHVQVSTDVAAFCILLLPAVHRWCHVMVQRAHGALSLSVPLQGVHPAAACDGGA